MSPLLRIAAAAVVALGAASAQDATVDPYARFRARVTGKIADIESSLQCRMAVSFADRDHPFRVAHRADELFHAASTMKTPVMIELFRQVDSGEIALDDALPVDASQPSFLETGTFECDSGELLAERLGGTATVRELNEQMIVVSDNLATNILLNRIGYRRVNSAMRALGADTGYVLRGPQDIAAWRAGLSNRMTAADLNVLLEAIDRDLAASPESCRTMREVLLRQHYDSRIPAKLPDGVRVAHKTGTIDGVCHDSGIVYAPFGTWYLTVLMDGVRSEPDGSAAIAELSRFVYDLREALEPELPEIRRDFRIDFTNSRIALTREYARAHYGPYYERTTGSPEMPSMQIEPKVIVVHYTAGRTLKGAFATFAPETLGGRPYLNRAGAVNVGIQFVVDRDGTIHELMPDDWFARHCIGLNHCAIGIENIGTGDITPSALRGAEPSDTGLTLAQLEANVRLIRRLTARYPGIGVLIGHHEYRDLERPDHPARDLFQEADPDYRTTKSDPGPRFMAELRARLADLLADPSTVPDAYRGQLLAPRR